MIAFFDLDGTLIPGISAEELFIKHLLFSGKIGVGNVFFTGLFFLRHLDDIGGTAVRANKMYLRGLSEEEVNTYAEEVFQKAILRRISEDGRREVEKLKNAGRRVVLLSASSTALVSRVATALGVHDAIATTLEFQDGRATGRTVSHVYGAHKVERAREYAARLNVSLAECSAYGNATSDASLLLSVGESYAVNPSRVLRKVAEGKRWPILRWR